MAKLVGTFFHPHGGTTSMAGEIWRNRRLARPIRADVPIEDDATNIEKARRTHEGFRILREKVAELKPDVMIVFGDDQYSFFDFNNCPPFAVYLGEEFTNGTKPGNFEGGKVAGRHAPTNTTFKGHKDLATAVLLGLMRRDFDPTFCMDMPKPDEGLDGSFIRTIEELTDWHLPVVPVMMNDYFAPQVTGRRSYMLGRAIREIIEEYPQDIRIAVAGSGGLWHTPNRKGAWLNDEFDAKTIELLAKGDPRGIAQHHDSYVVPEGDTSQDTSLPDPRTTGLPSVAQGPQFGTRETCNWIAAAAVADGSPTTIVDSIAVYASPVTNAYAYCDKILPLPPSKA